MAAVGAVGAVADTALAIRDKLRGKVSTVKVTRYWPGKKPEWANEADEDDDFVQKEVQTGFSRPSAREDARLRRLAESRRDREEAVQQHREIRAAEVVTTRRQEELEKEANRKAEREEEEDEEKIEERRQRIRERALQRREEEELPQEEEEEEEEESESEYETDSDGSDAGPKLRKPIFVPKAERDTIAERERLEAAEAAQEEELKKRLEQRKIETKQLVVEVVRQEEERAKNQEAEGADVDTDDEVNEEAEYEGWKARELARIKRDRAERAAVAKEKEELDKLRSMTEEERAEYERRNPKEHMQQAKKKWKFMQKYYHKGAFFQEEPDDKFGTAGAAEIFKRDFSEATGEDKMDKSILPKVMQVKHFGRAGRTKWTHLVDQDTTQWDTPWTTNDPLRAKYNQKMAAMSRPIEKPKGSKKLKDWEEPQKRYG